MARRIEVKEVRDFTTTTGKQATEVVFNNSRRLTFYWGTDEVVREYIKPAQFDKYFNLAKKEIEERRKGNK